MSAIKDRTVSSLAQVDFNIVRQKVDKGLWWIFGGERSNKNSRTLMEYPIHRKTNSAGDCRIRSPWALNKLNPVTHEYAIKDTLRTQSFPTQIWN